MHFQRWQKLKAKMVDGIIYVSSNPATSEKLLENITVPVVFMDRKIKKRENMGSVLIDNFSAMKDVAAYIAGKGCRQPAYITADISISPSKERYEGFVEGLEENGVCDIMEYHGYGVEIFDAWTDYCLMNPETTLSLDKKSTAYSAMICFIQTSAWYLGNKYTYFRAVGEIEKHHEERYRALLKNIETAQVFEKSEEKVGECRNCGHIVVGTKAPECNHPQSCFEVQEENY